MEPRTFRSASGVETTFKAVCLMLVVFDMAARIACLHSLRHDAVIPLLEFVSLRSKHKAGSEKESTGDRTMREKRIVVRE